jgi:hypothetical protein
MELTTFNINNLINSINEIKESKTFENKVLNDLINVSNCSQSLKELHESLMILDIIKNINIDNKNINIDNKNINIDNVELTELRSQLIKMKYSHNYIETIILIVKHHLK